MQSIAARWGFTSATAFSRAFRAAYETTPSEYRSDSLKVGEEPGRAGTVSRRTARQ